MACAAAVNVPAHVNQKTTGDNSESAAFICLFDSRIRAEHLCSLMMVLSLKSRPITNYKGSW
jgi:hypothetical protein